MSQHAFCLTHRQYRLNCADFEELIARATGRCEICGLPAERNHRGKLAIDHDHLLGRWAVRGLLCLSCNQFMHQLREQRDARRGIVTSYPFQKQPHVQRYLANPFRGLEHAHLIKVRFRPRPTGSTRELDREDAIRVLAAGGTMEAASVVLRLSVEDIEDLLEPVQESRDGSQEGGTVTEVPQIPENAMNVADAKARLSELVDTVSTTHDRVEITRNGKPVAVLMSVEEYVSLRETIAILSDAGAVAQIRDGEADVAAGRLSDAEDVRGAMLARNLETGTDGR